MMSVLGLLVLAAWYFVRDLLDLDPRMIIFPLGGKMNIMLRKIRHDPSLDLT